MEMVVLDAPPQALRYLLPTSSARLRLNEVVGSKGRSGNEVGGMLALFSRAIEVHIDTRALAAELNLNRFTQITRNLATDKLWLFSFLQEQVRDKKIPDMREKAQHYNQIYKQLVQIEWELTSPTKTGGRIMTAEQTRHERAVRLYYPGFYSPFTKNDTGKYKSPSTRAIVRPIDIAAKSVIVDTLNLTEGEIKLEMRQALRAWLDIVASNQATGRAYLSDKTDSRIKEFVDFFYEQVFKGYAEGQRSLLNSRLNRFKNGCEAAFWDIVRERKAEFKAKGKPNQDLPDTSQPTDEEA